MATAIERDLQERVKETFEMVRQWLVQEGIMEDEAQVIIGKISAFYHYCTPYKISQWLEIGIIGGKTSHDSLDVCLYLIRYPPLRPLDNLPDSKAHDDIMIAFENIRHQDPELINPDLHLIALCHGYDDNYGDVFPDGDSNVSFVEMLESFCHEDIESGEYIKAQYLGFLPSF